MSYIENTNNVYTSKNPKDTITSAEWNALMTLLIEQGNLQEHRVIDLEAAIADLIAISVPDDSISTAKIQDDAVTLNKLNSDVSTEISDTLIPTKISSMFDWNYTVGVAKVIGQRFLGLGYQVGKQLSTVTPNGSVSARLYSFYAINDGFIKVKYNLRHDSQHLSALAYTINVNGSPVEVITNINYPRGVIEKVIEVSKGNVIDLHCNAVQDSGNLATTIYLEAVRVYANPGSPFVYGDLEAFETTATSVNILNTIIA